MARPDELTFAPLGGITLTRPTGFLTSMAFPDSAGTFEPIRFPGASEPTI